MVSASLFIASVAVAQTGGDDAVSVVNSEKSGDYPIHVSGSIQSDILIPQKDEKIGAKDYDEWALTNTYAEVNAQSEYVDAGARFEFLEHPLPGFEKDLKGWGVPYFYVKGKYKWAELTLGDYYEQFGSGFILRTYEERSLGIDNSLRGGRLVLRPVKGVQLKALTGKQRRYWHHNKALVSGADLELSLDQWSKAMTESGTYVTLGASFVNKHEKKDDEVMVTPTYKLNLPENTNAFDVRARFQKGNVNLLAEYAQKTQDPSFDNEYIYRKGYVAMLSGSYSKQGMSLLLQAKRSENMAFKSARRVIGTSSAINHLPAFTQDHAYALAALYPYATQLAGGEWAWQAEAGYNFKRKTAIGGKYGMNVKLNFSHVRWEGTTYYQDLDVQVTRKLSSTFKLSLMYMNQRYNKTVVEGEGGMVRSNIFIADGLFQLAPKVKLRSELQYLATADDQGDWTFGLLELSLAPHWMFTVSDMWNNGDTKIHYYQGLVAFSSGSHRLQAGYGRTRAGYNCSGGVCRYVPATKGFTLSYNYNF